MHVHIIGICGTFMGGIAALAQAAGHRVTGSDRAVYPPMSTQLAALGVELIEGYEPSQLDLNPDIVVVGNVMSHGIPLSSRRSIKGLPRLMTLPTTTMSGFRSSCEGSYPSISSTPSAASWVLIGG